MAMAAQAACSAEMVCRQLVPFHHQYGHRRPVLCQVNAEGLVVRNVAVLPLNVSPNLLDGLVTGLLLFMLSSGLTLIFSMMGSVQLPVMVY